MKTMLNVGYAKVNITPNESVPMGGYGNAIHRLSDHVLNDLYATCLAFSDERGEPALLYALDLISTGDPYDHYIRTAISKATGIPEERIMASATHSHSTPDMFTTQMESIVRFLANLEQWLVQAAQQALADLKPARMFINRVQTRDVNFVRRYILENGAPAGDNYGPWGTSPIARHETEPDREMQLVKFVREGCKDIIVANFQTHPHRTGGMAKHNISSDIVGAMREKMEAELDCQFAYFSGGSGNINPTSKIPEENVYSDHTAHGQAMADFAISVSDSYTEVQTGPVRFGWEWVEAETDHNSDGMLADAEYIWNNFLATGDRVTWNPESVKRGFNSVYHANAVISKAKRPDRVKVPFSALSIGDVAFCLAPYEMFDTNGLQIKQGSPFQMTMVLTLSNRSGMGYVPSELGFQNGGYSTDSCWFKPGAGEFFAREQITLLKRLYENQ